MFLQDVCDRTQEAAGVAIRMSIALLTATRVHASIQHSQQIFRCTSRQRMVWEIRRDQYPETVKSGRGRRLVRGYRENTSTCLRFTDHEDGRGIVFGPIYSIDKCYSSELPPCFCAGLDFPPSL